MKITMLIVMFLFIGAFFIISQNNLSLNTHENINKFVSDYTGWLGNLFENAGALTGYVIKMKWLPQPNIPADE